MSRTSSKKAKSLALPEKPALTVPASDGDVVATVVSRKRKADSQTPVTDGIVSSGLAKLPAPTSAGRRSRRSGASAMHDLPCGKKLLAKDSAALHQAVQELLVRRSCLSAHLYLFAYSSVCLSDVLNNGALSLTRLSVYLMC